MKAMAWVFLVVVFTVAQIEPSEAVCIPNQGQWTIGANTAEYKVCGTDGSTWASVGGGGSLPAGIIVFTAGACPATWTEYTAAQGFAVVGLVAGGTAAGTVGTALTNLQDKTHAHTYTDVVNHTHPENVPSSASAGTLKTAIDTNASGAQDSGSVTANPTGGVATGTTATKATSDVIAYIQLRACSKD